VGLAKHNPSGHWRLGLSATAASAVLYSAIVLFGVGSASPSAPAAGRDPHASAVLIQPQADTVSGSAQRLPQASPEPRRHRLRARASRPRTGIVPPAPTSSATATIAAPAPASPRKTESESPSITGSAAASVAEAPPVVSLPLISPPVVTVPVPDLPVPLPGVPAALPLPLLP
jgi:hypothetical protein